MKKAAVALLVLALFACSSGPVHSPRLLSSRGPGVGDQRLVVEFADRGSNAPLAPADVTATLRNRNGSPLSDAEGSEIRVAPGGRTAYVFHFEIPEPGTYQLTFEAEGVSFAGPVGIEAVANPPVVAVGDPAPRTVTASAADAPLDRLTSDPHPDPSLYELTVAEAVESAAAVIVFGSPGHCSSGTCGSVLETVKGVVHDLPDVAFVHIETVQLPAGDPPRHVPAVADWGLVVEPAVFVVRDGTVVAYFESVISDEELRGAVAP